MKFAIIAAGEGSRLAAEGINAPKPLVTVDGQYLIDRLIGVFMDCDADETVVICNQLTILVSQHLADIKAHGLNGKKIPLSFVTKTTPSSMHSFYELSSLLGDEPFCMTTVDTIFRPDEFKRYIAEFKSAIANGYDGMMGVTDYIDDEKPLYVSTDNELNITAFLDQSDTCKYISGGIYGLTHKAIDTLNGCMRRGESRMRNFQRALLADGRKLKAYPFSKVLDIDHASDIEKAEAFLHSKGNNSSLLTSHSSLYGKEFQ